MVITSDRPRTSDPDQFALFDRAELEPKPVPPERPAQWAGLPEGPRHDGEFTGPCIYETGARGLAARLADFDLWKELYGGFGSIARSHGWHHHGFGDLAMDRCEPMVLSADLRPSGKWLPGGWRDDPEPSPCMAVHGRGGRFGVYRSFCRGCDWEGPSRDDENSAAEDGCDHAHPGWRELPPVPEVPYIGGSMSSKTNQKEIAAWAAKVNAVYPEFWLENGGPIRTRRDPPGTRHVGGRTPWGGYDLSMSAAEAAALAARLDPSPVPDPLQFALVGECWECDYGGHVCERCRQPGEHGRSWHVTCPPLPA